jgi:glycosyltransferase involved in cell wall biosynthesis
MDEPGTVRAPLAVGSRAPGRRVVLAHDYLTQRGGAERVVIALSRIFPDAPILTSVYEKDATFGEFQTRHIATSYLQLSGPVRRDPRRALPLLADAWNRMPVPSCDVVVASSSGWAHGVRVPSGAAKVVYCHNPPRWLHQTDHYVTRRRERLALAALARPLRRWDRRAAASADLYLANSTAVAGRIRAVYGIDPVVLHPPVVVDVDGPQAAVPRVEPGYWLTVSRGRAYKNVRAVVEAVERGGLGRLVVVGQEPPGGGESSGRVRWTGTVSDAELRWLYAHARALVTVAHEDFGLTPLEANAFGTPALALRAGGHLDSVDDGISGAWIREPTVDAVRDALLGCPDFDTERVRMHAAAFSFEAFSRALQHEIAQARDGR